MAEEIEVLERGSDMVLAAHRTLVGWGTVATTIETVRFDRPATVAFRLLRGPVAVMSAAEAIEHLVGLQAQAAGSGSREHVGVGETADRSKFLELSFGLMVPPRRGDEPALFRLGFDLRLTHVEVAIGGLVAVAIVWLATRSGPAGPDRQSRAALSEAAGEDGAAASLARRSAGSDAHQRRSSGARSERSTPPPSSG